GCEQTPRAKKVSDIWGDSPRVSQSLFFLVNFCNLSGGPQAYTSVFFAGTELNCCTRFSHPATGSSGSSGFLANRAGIGTDRTVSHFLLRPGRDIFPFFCTVAAAAEPVK